MQKFRLKEENYTFDVKGMILNGDIQGDLVYVNADEICKINEDIMTKNNIRVCLQNGCFDTWIYPLEKLEHLEKIEVTVLERELLKRYYNNGCRYIARDESNSLYFYKVKPIKKNTIWNHPVYEDSTCYRIEEFEDLFKFVAWRNKEPTNIKEVLDNNDIISSLEEINIVSKLEKALNKACEGLNKFDCSLERTMSKICNYHVLSVEEWKEWALKDD